jgi:hypothetical protein
MTCSVDVTRKMCKDRRASVIIISGLLLSICSIPCRHSDILKLRSSPHTLPTDLRVKSAIRSKVLLKTLCVFHKRAQDNIHER